MANVAHATLTAAELHALARWTWANAAARNAQSVVAGDIAKVGWQQDTNVWYFLASTGPTVWVSIPPGLPAGAIVGTTDTQTLTNKRVTKRTGTVASSATPTINTDTVDFFSITALAVAITSFTTNLSGTPTAGQTLWIAITDNGTPRAITWGASFEASTIALPTTTVASARLDVGFVWNDSTSAWRCVATA